MMTTVVELILLSLLATEPASALERGVRALESLDARGALAHLQEARAAGPFSLEDHIMLYEQLGIAHAYLEQEERSRTAFEMLLALDPGHVISYTLSPKVTFLFESMRAEADRQPSSTVDLSWARGRRVEETLPLSIEVLDDPKQILATARVHSRLRGQRQYGSVATSLMPRGEPTLIEIPPPDPHAETDQIVELYLSAYDQRGNEVLRVGSPKRPREVTLTYVRPDPWYKKWWVWASAGVIVAAGTGIAVFVARREPNERIDGSGGLVYGD